MLSSRTQIPSTNWSRYRLMNYIYLLISKFLIPSSNIPSGLRHYKTIIQTMKYWNRLLNHVRRPLTKGVCVSHLPPHTVQQLYSRVMFSRHKLDAAPRLQQARFQVFFPFFFSSSFTNLSLATVVICESHEVIELVGWLFVEKRGHLLQVITLFLYRSLRKLTRKELPSKCFRNVLPSFVNDVKWH